MHNEILVVDDPISLNNPPFNNYYSPPQLIMQVNLLGKTALVTGSLSGIGLGIAKSLAASGANVILNGFASDDVISKIKADLKTKENRVEFIHADLQKPEEAKSLVKKGIEMFKGIDILVNNAGRQFTAKTVDFPENTWEDIISLNLSASFYTSRYALPHMLEKNWGRIINIASVHGLVASVNKSAYVAAKHGLVGFTKVLALETAKTGVTCNSICPGFVFTPLI